MLRAVLFVLGIPLPWALRRRWWSLCFGWQLHPGARIGLALVLPQQLVLEDGARIGHFTVVKGLTLLHLHVRASIGRGNWITGHPVGDQRHFIHLPERRCELVLEREAALTNRHLIDCTDAIHIGAFATVAGFSSQFLTHSIDLVAGRQHAKPITIGAYCFVGTDVTVLGGAVLPERSVLGAKSLLNKAHVDPGMLYAGVPAVAIKAMPTEAAYFNRRIGFVG